MLHASASTLSPRWAPHGPQCKACPRRRRRRLALLQPFVPSPESRQSQQQAANTLPKQMALPPLQLLQLLMKQMALPPLQLLQLLQFLQLLMQSPPEASSSSSSAAAHPPAPPHRAVQLLMKQMALPLLQQVVMKRPREASRCTWILQQSPAHRASTMHPLPQFIGVYDGSSNGIS